MAMARRFLPEQTCSGGTILKQGFVMQPQANVNRLVESYDPCGVRILQNKYQVFGNQLFKFNLAAYFFFLRPQD